MKKKNNIEIKGAVFSDESTELYNNLFKRCEYCGSVIIHKDHCLLKDKDKNNE